MHAISLPLRVADAMQTYDMVRTEQAKVMMAGAKKNSAIY